MSKGKLKKFAEVDTFPNVIQVSFREVMNRDHELKGNWNRSFLKNDNPIVLELGCGKGEYTVGLARQNPELNFIGIDIKGARIWKGAKYALDNGITNAFFLRTRIDFIDSFFGMNEIREIWITFPDPQPKKPLKRLTSSRFLNKYRTFLIDDGSVNLKTDNKELFRYTCSLAKHNQMEIESMTDNLYDSELVNEQLSLKTFYEKMWIDQGSDIHYLRFRLDKNTKCTEPPDENK